jgi:3-deoxy-D-manno-octulosonic-acid transferase
MRFFYSILLYLIAPLAWAATAWKGWRDPAYRERLGERFGFTRLRFRECIWVHAVSVGEVQAAIPVVKALQARYPQLPLVITTATPTGAQRVKSVFGDRVHHCYLPYDLPGAVRRFIGRIHPRFGVVMETEIWPNLYSLCRARKIPLLIASARLSERSVERYRSFPLFARALENVAIAAQSERDAERFRAIGVPAAQIQVAGNVKFDLQIDPDLSIKAERLRAEQIGSRPVWVAASTHGGEEAIVLDAHRAMLERHPDALLILVPRHPQRFEEVRSLLASRSIRFASRSRNEPVTDANEVLLVDTLGELMLFYAAGDIAFVGGSLVPIGGHNLLEPAALGRAILVGPHNFNAPDIAQNLIAAGAATVIQGAGDLAESVSLLFSDPSKCAQMGQRGREVVESNRGAVERVMGMVDGAEKRRES